VAAERAAAMMMTGSGVLHPRARNSLLSNCYENVTKIALQTSTATTTTTTRLRHNKTSGGSNTITCCRLPAAQSLPLAALLPLPTVALLLPTAYPSPAHININTTPAAVAATAETATAAQLRGRITTTTIRHPFSLLALPVAYIASSGQSQIGILKSSQTAHNPVDAIFTMYLTL